jgi:protein-L-isoaspartate(D-aspartate) O-methyltransferase
VALLRAQRGIRDERVLAAMAAVPRHLFFEAAFEAHAYQDKAFPIGEGQTISQPATVAYQTELLDVQPGQRILEIGTGSGYQFAVLCQLTNHVQSIELNPVLFARGQARLAALGLPTDGLHLGDGSLGWPAGAPYDGILVTAGAPRCCGSCALGGGWWCRWAARTPAGSSSCASRARGPKPLCAKSLVAVASCRCWGPRAGSKG